MNAFRLMTFVGVAVGLALYLYFPDRLLLIVLCEVVAGLVLFLLTMKPIAEPDRAVVYRLATFHHIAGPGYVFLVPTLDRIEGVLDMGPRDLTVEVPGVRSFDRQHVRTNLEVTWRIHPHIQGRLNNRMKLMIMASDEQRAKLVQEVVIRMARQIVSGYTNEQLAPPENREAAAATMVDAVNEMLEPDGLRVERIFWRGSAFPTKLLEARLESAVRLEHAESLIAMVEAIKKRLPDMQPEEFLALQAWLDMFRRGGLGGQGQPPTPSSD